MARLAVTLAALLLAVAPAAQASDRRPPRLTSSVPPSQRLLLHGFLWVYASCDEPCAVAASGRLLIGQLSYPLARARSSGRAGQRLVLKVRLTPMARAALRRALRHDRRARAIVTIYARDAAGNRSRELTRIVRVRPAGAARRA